MIDTQPFLSDSELEAAFDNGLREGKAYVGLRNVANLAVTSYVAGSHQNGRRHATAIAMGLIFCNDGTIWRFRPGAPPMTGGTLEHLGEIPQP